MHPTEYYWLAETRKPKKMYGNMTEEEVAAIYAETYGDEEYG